MARVALEDWQEQIRDPKIECMSRDEMTALQSDRLVKQVKNVYENVAFYRKKMDDMGVEPGDIKGIEDIGKLPFTTKEDLRANYPFGLLAVPQEKIVRVQGTSGTTGKLTLASYTEKDVDVWGECVARGLTMAGLNAADRIHICYGYGLFTGGLGLDFGARKLGAMAIPMSAGNTKRQLMCMEDFGATAFACTPSYALYLGEAAKEAGVTISCDLNYRNKLWTKAKAGEVMGELCKYVDVCIANEEDASDVFGIKASNTDVTKGAVNHEGYKDVAKQLADRFGFQKVAITLRESISANDNNWSAMLYDGKDYYFSKKYAMHIVDRVGGGDSFGGGLIYACLSDMDAQSIIEFAVAASCLKHSIEGDMNMVSVDEVKKLAGGDGSGRVQR